MVFLAHFLMTYYSCAALYLCKGSMPCLVVSEEQLNTFNILILRVRSFTRVELLCGEINVLEDPTTSYYFLSLVISDKSYS